MEHDVMIWADGDDESESERGTLAIEGDRLSMRLGSSEIGSWGLDQVRLASEPDGLFSAQVGDNRLMLRAEDSGTFSAEIRAQSIRSKLASSSLPAPVVPSEPAPSAFPPQTLSVVVGSAKSPGVAAVLSALWPGLGQIYNGQVGLAVMFIGLQVINAVLVFALVGFVTGFITWVWAIANAHSGAQQYNRARGIIS